MREIKNINWNVEKQFPNIQFDYKNEDSFSDDCWAVAFDWNGYRLTAHLDIRLDLSTYEEDEVGFYEVCVESFNLELLELYDSECSEWSCDIREFQDIQAKLLDELKVMV